MSNPGSGYGASAPPAPYQSWQPGGQSGQYGSPYVQSPQGMPTGTPYSAPPPTGGSSPYSAAPPSGVPYSGYGGSAPTQQWAQPQSGYPGAYPQPYGAYPQQAPNYGPQFPPGTDQDIIQAFQGADRDNSGTIDDLELQKALSTGQPFSLRTVHLMLHLFANGAKRIGPAQFATLWKNLREWRGIFERFDRDRSGRIDSGELRDALFSLGYAVPPSVLQLVVSRYDKTGQARGIDYDNFVECGLVLKGLTEKFKEKDTKLSGSATISYEAFMLMVLPFIIA